MLYFAYGSNLWRQQMVLRCPGHSYVGAGTMTGWRWIITTRGYASIVESDADYVLGAVYELSDEDIRSLDQFEGVARGHYRKEIITVDMDGCSKSCLTYVDPIVEVGAPKKEYIDRINLALQDAGFPDDYVNQYVRKFIPEKSLS